MKCKLQISNNTGSKTSSYIYLKIAMFFRNLKPHTLPGMILQSLTLDEALDMNPIGLFQYRILLMCGLAFMADALEVTKVNSLLLVYLTRFIDLEG
jgi:hypothetical protein